MLFGIGFAIGVFSNFALNKPKEQKISHYNWISRYDLYDYEEAVLKKGDMDKMFDITNEADVDRLPYVIVMYDVYKKDVYERLMQIYTTYNTDYCKRNPYAIIPLRNFVNRIISEYKVMGEHIYTERHNKRQER